MTLLSYYFLGRWKSYNLLPSLRNGASPGLIFQIKNTASRHNFLVTCVSGARDAFANLRLWNCGKES